jgi:hypothetical protein
MPSLVRVIPLLAAAAATFGASPSAAQSPQSYPYCAIDTAIGATSCYYSSREQCGSRCISNPSYQGPQSARASAPRGRHAASRR